MSSMALAEYPELTIKQIQGLDLASCPSLIYNANVYKTRSTQAFINMFLEESLKYASCLSQPSGRALRPEAPSSAPAARGRRG